MSALPSNSPRSTPPDHEVPDLADSNHDSTQPVPDDDGHEGDHLAEESDAGVSRLLRPSDTNTTEGTTTGGFDTMLGKLAVERGLVTPEEMELCNSLLREVNADASSTGSQIQTREVMAETAPDSSDSDVEDMAGLRTLPDLLIDNEFITHRQLERLRDEFEAKKSSQQIPGYRIKRKIGAGAMATVFLAKQLSLDRLVAIKVLPRKFSENPQFIDRFYKEGRAAAQLNHPNIVQAYDVGQAGEHHYFVMEYVDGPTVYDRIVQDKRMDEAESVEVIRQVAKALEHAHHRGFIHRDIKPKNIMINRQGVVKLADLGLARAMSDKDAAKAEAGRAYGTPYYISPEQIRGEVSIGPQADIYGLGATFYHMVTGRVPFTGKNPSSVMHKHLKTEMRPPDHVNPKLSAGCAQVIEMMMAKRATDRYQSAHDLAHDLELIGRGEAPHFAHHNVDLTKIAEEIATAPASEPVVMGGESHPGLIKSPLFMVVLVLALVSLIVNAIMLAVLAS